MTQARRDADPMGGIRNPETREDPGIRATGEEPIPAPQWPLGPKGIDPTEAASALPDDRYDGNDSGAGGTDLPYPRGAAADAPDTEGAAALSKAATSPVEASRSTAGADPGTGPGNEASTGSDYATDGPDDLGDTPQR